MSGLLNRPCRPALLRFCAPDLAEDTVQEALVEVLRGQQRRLRLAAPVSRIAPSRAG